MDINDISDVRHYFFPCSISQEKWTFKEMWKIVPVNKLLFIQHAVWLWNFLPQFLRSKTFQTQCIKSYSVKVFLQHYCGNNNTLRMHITPVLQDLFKIWGKTQDERQTTLPLTTVHTLFPKEVVWATFRQETKPSKWEIWYSMEILINWEVQ